MNKNGKTVAIILAYKGIIPPKEWYHDKYLCDKDCHTVAYYLLKNNK